MSRRCQQKKERSVKDRALPPGLHELHILSPPPYPVSRKFYPLSGTASSAGTRSRRTAPAQRPGSPGEVRTAIVGVSLPPEAPHAVARPRPPAPAPAPALGVVPCRLGRG